MTGHRQFCKESKNFGIDELEQGTLGDYAIREESNAFKVPNKIESKYAGPFVCAGVSSAWTVVLLLVWGV